MIPNFKALPKVFKEKRNGIDIFPAQLQKGHQQWKQTKMIMVGMWKMKGSHKSLLHRLALRWFWENTFHSGEMKSMPSWIQMSNGGETPNEQAMPQFVPPLAAPMQAEPLHDTGRLVVAVLSRLCAWAPLCKYPAVVYNGFKHADCVRAGVEFDIPRDEVDLAQFEHERSKSRLAKKRQREAVRRMKKRAARNLPAV